MKSSTKLLIVSFLFPLLLQIYFAIQFCVFPVVVFADLVRAIVQPKEIPYSLLLYGEQVFSMFACWVAVIAFLASRG